MKESFIVDLAENQTIQSDFLVKEKSLRARRNNPAKTYLSVKLGDRTGELEGRVWENAEELAQQFDVHDFIRVSARVEVYQGTKQLNIRSLRPSPPLEVDPADFLPRTESDVDQIYSDLVARVERFANELLKRLLLALLEEPELALRLKRAPAAVTMHHAYVGGLLEHVASLVELAERVAAQYPDLDVELLQAGAILHDIGKVYEFDYSTGFSYTTRGRLVGHMAIGLELIREKTANIEGFPEDLRLRVEHMVLSHHGEYEFGSPVLPAFPEALTLHYLDQLDSKLQSIKSQYQRDARLSGEWTGRNRALGRFLLKPQDTASEGKISTDQQVSPPEPPPKPSPSAKRGEQADR